MHTRYIIAILLLLLSQSVEAYTPPIGIPTPEFGADEQPGAITMYVEETNPACNNANSGADPAAPKCNIPLTTLAPDTHVRVVGLYTFNHGVPNDIICGGTLADPVFITGGNWQNGVDIVGTYCIIDVDAGISFHFTNDGVSDAHHMALRDTPINAFNGDGGVFIGSATTTAGISISQILILRVSVQNTGDFSDPGDDNHCMVVGSNGGSNEEVSEIFILSSTMVRCNGDGVQVNGGGHATRWESLHHIYLGGNACSTNRQLCLWAKQSKFVAMVGNFSTDMHIDVAGGNPGACYGTQYGSTSLFIARNACLNSDNCVIVASSSDTGSPNFTPYGSGVFIVGNICKNIHATTGSTLISSGFASGTCIRINGGRTNVYVINNTIVDCDGGIKASVGAPDITRYNNIHKGSDIVDLMLEQGSDDTGSGYNLYSVNLHYYIDGVNGTANQAALTPSHSLIGDPLFIDEAGNNFRVEESSPATNAGNGIDIDATYEALHGSPLTLGVDTEMIGARPFVPDGGGGGGDCVCTPPVD